MSHPTHYEARPDAAAPMGGCHWKECSIALNLAISWKREMARLSLLLPKFSATTAPTVSPKQ